MEKTPGSTTQRSLAAFPAGSNGEFNLPPELVRVITHGKGCELFDSEGNRFIDFSMGWGSALVGHAHPGVTQAVRHQATRGANFAYITQPALELAEEVIEASPACEQLRFCASGTEATMYCLRIARAATGKDKILKFEGAYHGAHDIGVTSLMPRAWRPFPVPEPSCDGLDPAIRQHVLVAPFNDLETTRRIIDEHAAELAAVIVEPLHRCLPPVAGFLEGLRAAVTAYNGLLVFDEVVTGFRLAYGGAQELYGVVPDLVAYGKALGGGFPIGAFGGRKELMELVSEDRLGGDAPYVWTASTLGGNPVSAAAGRATLAALRQPGSYEHLNQLGEYLRTGMTRVLREQSVPGHVIGAGPLAQIVLTADPTPPTDFRSLKRGDSKANRALMLGLFRRGVFLNPMGTKLYLSLAHTESICDELLDHLDAALRSLPST